MAEMKMNDYLSRCFRQLRFEDMPAAQRAQFEAFVSKGDHRGHSKEWEEEFLKHDAAGNLVKVGKSYLNADLPDSKDASVLSDEEVVKLYKAFRKGFRGMASNREDIVKEYTKNGKNPVLKFLDGNFGAGRLFQNPTASDAAKNAIKNSLLPMLNAQPALENILRQNGVLDDKFSFSDLRTGLGSGKYDRDSKFADKVIDTAKAIRNAAAYDEELRNALGVFNFEDIINGFDNQPINATTLGDFREQLPLLLNELHRNDKIRKAFGENGGAKITQHYDDAEKRVAYHDEENDDYIPPKKDDTLTPWQQLQENFHDTYDQVLRKYIRLKGDDLFLQPQAKNIVSVFSKVKIKPTDGLGAIVDKAADIKKNLQHKSPRDAVDHFDWTINALKYAKQTAPKAFDGALKNGWQLNAIAEKIIEHAVDEGEIDKAKTALEMLSVCKYGYTTSKIMDAMRGAEVSIFSDGKLSWNKNEGMRFLTTAMDKGIKYAFLGIGYGLNALGHAVKLNSHVTRFGKNSKLADKARATAANNAAEKTADFAQFDAEDVKDRTAITAEEQKLVDLNRGAYAGMAVINESTRDTVQHNLDVARQNEAAQRTALEGRKAAYDAAKGAEQQHDEYRQQLADLDRNKTMLEGRLIRIRNDISALSGATLPSDMARLRALAQRELDLVDQIADLDSQRTDVNNALAGITLSPTVIRDYERAKTDLNDLTSANDITASRLEQFKDGTRTINELKQHITDRQTARDKWDDGHKNIEAELLSYWNLLERGRMSGAGPLHTHAPHKRDTNQAAFDAKKDGLVLAALANSNKNLGI